jgi:hypothetical protein
MDNKFVLTSCQDELQELIDSQILIESVILKLQNKKCHESGKVESPESILDKINFFMELYRDIKVSMRLRNIDRKIQEYRDNLNVVDKLEKIWSECDE